MHAMVLKKKTELTAFAEVIVFNITAVCGHTDTHIYIYIYIYINWGIVLINVDL